MGAQKPLQPEPTKDADVKRMQDLEAAMQWIFDAGKAEDIRRQAQDLFLCAVDPRCRPDGIAGPVELRALVLSFQSIVARYGLLTERQSRVIRLRELLDVFAPKRAETVAREGESALHPDVRRAMQDIGELKITAEDLRI